MTAEKKSLDELCGEAEERLKRALIELKEAQAIVVGIEKTYGLSYDLDEGVKAEVLECLVDANDGLESALLFLAKGDRVREAVPLDETFDVTKLLEELSKGDPSET